MNYTRYHVTFASRVRCLNFGFGNHETAPVNDSVVASYSKRAPVDGLDVPETKQGASYHQFCEKCDFFHNDDCRQRTNWTNPYCRMCRFCVHVEPLLKTLYFPSKKPVNFKVGVHYPVFSKKEKDYAMELLTGWTDKRRQGILCNHYRYRSFVDVTAKARRNHASSSFKNLPRNHPYFSVLNSVTDTTAMDYLLARRKVLQLHGVIIF